MKRFKATFVIGFQDIVDIVDGVILVAGVSSCSERCQADSSLGAVLKSKSLESMQHPFLASSGQRVGEIVINGLQDTFSLVSEDGTELLSGVLRCFSERHVVMIPDLLAKVVLMEDISKDCFVECFDDAFNISDVFRGYIVPFLGLLTEHILKYGRIDCSGQF